MELAVGNRLGLLPVRERGALWCVRITLTHVASKKANRCGRLPRDEKLGGFQPPLPLYRTETHVCSSQKRGAAHREEDKNQNQNQNTYETNMEL